MTDDSMSDDVFEDETKSGPTNTGYRDYEPPPDILNHYSGVQREEDVPIHKTILLGDSGVGKTSLLVQFETGRFQSGNFSATVGIGFTGRPTMWERSGEGTDGTKRVVVNRVRPMWASQEPGQAAPPRRPPRTPSFEGPPLRPQPEPYDIFCKVMLLGDSGVGKTCLLVRFRDGTFLGGNYISTVGIDFRNKVVTVDGCKVKLQIWDTAGQERFRSVTHAYYRDAHALLLLYDVTNKTSFDNIRAWLGEIREYAQEDVVIMLLGNKCDSGSDREVRREEGERLAREYRVAFMETSAKTGVNVETAFNAIARELRARCMGAPPSLAAPGAERFCVHEYVRDQAHRATCPPCNT